MFMCKVRHRSGQTQWRKLCTQVRKSNRNKKLWSFWKVWRLSSLLSIWQVGGERKGFSTYFINYYLISMFVFIWWNTGKLTFVTAGSLLAVLLLSQTTPTLVSTSSTLLALPSSPLVNCWLLQMFDPTFLSWFTFTPSAPCTCRLLIHMYEFCFASTVVRIRLILDLWPQTCGNMTIIS